MSTTVLTERQTRDAQLAREILARLVSAIKRDRWMRQQLWDDLVLMRAWLIRLERGDTAAWSEFVHHVGQGGKRPLNEVVGQLLANWEFGSLDVRLNFVPYKIIADACRLEGIGELLQALALGTPSLCATPAAKLASKKAKSAIMYIEAKPGITGPGRIGRIHLSKTGKTIYYRSQAFQSLKGGYKCNYFDTETGNHFWISRCRKDGQDTLYPGIVEIDEDIREEYWRMIRKRPDLMAHRSFRSEGKYRR